MHIGSSPKIVVDYLYTHAGLQIVNDALKAHFGERVLFFTDGKWIIYTIDPNVKLERTVPLSEYFRIGG